MTRSLHAALGAALVSLPALAQQPRPDARLEQAVNTIVVAEVNRSVLFERTLPLPPLAARARPTVQEPDMVRASESLYIERALVRPRGEAADERGAVRVFPRDAR